jgi:hypothetical protein
MSSCESTFLPVNLDVFVPTVSGETYREGVKIRIDGMDQELTRIKVTFQKNPSSTTIDLVLDSDLAQIELVSTGADNWEFWIYEFECLLSYADYFYQIQATYGSGSKTSVVSGIFCVKPSIP